MKQTIVAGLLTALLSTQTLPMAWGQPLLATRNIPSNERLVSLLTTIAPKSTSCKDVDPAEVDECATAQEAAPFIRQALLDYDITNAWEQACVLSNMAMETGQFRYNINHFPGRPGQGTRNMQMVEFNLLYAASFDEHLPALRQIVGCQDPTTVNATALPDTKKNDVRELVLPDEYTWGSGSWYLATKCTPAERSIIQAGGPKALETFILCLDATPSQERSDYFDLAVEALGLNAS